jgi:predicted nucleic acid-binding protein
LIAVDTNVLVYAHRIESEFCQPAAAAIRRLPESPEQWAIPWPCLHEFLAVVTHPAIFRVSSVVEAAISQIEI